MQHYKDAKTWEKIDAFTLKVYEVTKLFPMDELYNLTNQIRRSASPIHSYIAEGSCKNSQTGLAHYLNISFGSEKEAEHFLLLSKDLNYLQQEKYLVAENFIKEIKSMFISLIFTVRNLTS